MFYFFFLFTPKSPSDKLSNLCLISPEMDLDQITKVIDAEEFVLESFKESSGAKSQADCELALGWIWFKIFLALKFH